MRYFILCAALCAACSTDNGGAGSGGDLGGGGGGGGGNGDGGCGGDCVGGDASASSDGGANTDGSRGGTDGGRTSFPIDHIVIIVKENHTFDNYFGSFPGAEGTQVAQTSTGTVQVQEPPLQLTRDLCHDHSCALADWNGGAMNHWDLGDTRNANDNLAFAQYTEQDIPNYWQYAKHFTLGDHFFSSMLGPSFPGHMFALAAQSGWALGNPASSGIGPLVTWGCDDPVGSDPANPQTTQEVLDNGSCTVKKVFPCYKFPTVPDLLPSNVTWKFYGSKLPPFIGETWSMFDAVDQIRNTDKWKNNVVDESTFDQDVANGTLPNVVWLVPQDQHSEHPPFNICSGENWTVGHINAVMKSSYWSHTAIVFTYDDFGGWYDHVPPPMQYGCNAQTPYGLGFRLPLIILSPYAKPGYIMHSVAHQASLPKLVETLFGLQSLNSLDPAAQDGPGTSDLLDAFDFNQTPNPPLVLPTRSCLGER